MLRDAHIYTPLPARNFRHGDCLNVGALIIRIGFFLLGAGGIIAYR